MVLEHASKRIMKHRMESDTIRSGTEGKQMESKVAKKKCIKPKLKKNSKVVKSG